LSGKPFFFNQERKGNSIAPVKTVLKTTYFCKTMQVLIVTATVKEIAPLLEYYRNSKHLGNTDVLISGIGLTATAYRLTKQINLKRPDLIIQAGVAGSFDKNIKPGEVVVVKQDTIADESVVELEKLKTIFDLKFVPQNQFPFKKGWLINLNSDLFKKIKLRSVKAVSVNQISVSKQAISFYQQKFKPAIESMEGAALHYVCLMEKIPFLQVRSISNYIGERNKKNWDMKTSIENLNNELILFLNKLSRN
jgi:futalosine hydrolase